MARNERVFTQRCRFWIVSSKYGLCKRFHASRFEGFLVGIDTKIQLYKPCGSYCVRTVSSLPAETAVGAIQDMNINRSMSVRANDIPRILSGLTEIMTYKLNPDRGFYMKTSRSAVYPVVLGNKHRETEKDADELNRSGKEYIQLLTKSDQPIDFVYTWVNGSDPIHESLTNNFKCSFVFGSNHKGTTTDEPIDIVYTWVNGSDPVHRSLVSTFKRSFGSNHSGLLDNRFEDWNTLKYSLRSVEKFANWTRHIFIVTNGQIPQWLNLQNPRISVVTHEEIFRNKSHLPTFSSGAILSNIHRIEGLSRRFIYMDDDFFLLAPVSITDYYTKTDGYKIRFSKNPISCSKTCDQSDVNNGVCDNGCQNALCEWDGEDCVHKQNHDQHRLHNLDDSNIWTLNMLHTSYQFNKLFGPRRRKPMAHCSVFINKEILTQLHDRLASEWDLTSSRQVRDSNNLQFQFAYIHYLVELSYLPESYVKVKWVDQVDYTDTAITANLNRTLALIEIPKLFARRGMKFATVSDQVKQSVPAHKKREIQEIVDDVFTKIYPKPSEFEITTP